MTKKEQIEEQASHWVSLELEGQNLYKNKDFLLWIKENDSHKIAFEEEKKFINELHCLPKDFIDELKNEVNESIEQRNKKRQSKNKFLKIFTSISSAACIAFVLYLSFFMESITFSKQYLASNKVLKNITLPDNSKITLNTNTKIDVRYYESKREIFLSEGKAVFDVEANKQRPFIIKTQRVDITVLGTKFEVINSKNQIQVNVTEGVVKVTNPHFHDSLLVRVEKAQSATLDKYSNLKKLEKVDIKKVAPWSEGKFSFYQESIENIIKEFSKYIDIDVKIENEKIASLPISGNFSANSFDDFLKVLPLVHPITVKEEKGKILIKDNI